ncbi:MAG TPA: hypothetical protein VF134_02110 [Candidatus Dormibacteraeota bacterium]
MAVLLIGLLWGLSSLTATREVAASSWGSAYGDPWGFCPWYSFLPYTYTSVVTNDPSVPNNPERDTFWGIHYDPGWDQWYGYWYGDFAGHPGDDSGWHYITTSYYGGPPGHWNFADFGWQVHGHAKQFVGYYNWTFGGSCGYGYFGAGGPPPYMADVYGWPVVDIYVDSVPPNPPVPVVIGVTTSSVSFSWGPVSDRGDGAGADYFVAGFDHFLSWVTVNGGPPQQYAATPYPRALTASGLAAGQTACVHVSAFDALGNGTGDQVACGSVLAPPPPPPAPPPPSVQINPWPAGLTGLDSYFWLSPRPASVYNVEYVGSTEYVVSSRPEQVTWVFGDGGEDFYSVPAGFGQAYPMPATVVHRYQTQSAGGYPVSAIITYARSWEVLSGGTWLGPYGMDIVEVMAGPVFYPVRQAQPEITGFG